MVVQAEDIGAGSKSRCSVAPSTQEAMMLTGRDLLLTTVLCPDDDLLTERAKSLRGGNPVTAGGVGIAGVAA